MVDMDPQASLSSMTGLRPEIDFTHKGTIYDAIRYDDPLPMSEVIRKTYFHGLDIAAGGLLVQEAGGIVGDFEGNESWLKTGNIVAANPKVFALMLQTLAPHLTESLKSPK